MIPSRLERRMHLPHYVTVGAVGPWTPAPGPPPRPALDRRSQIGNDMV